MPDDPGFVPFRQAWRLIREQARELGEDAREAIQNQFNTIEAIEEFDCGGDWALYVRTALDAAGDALWLLIVPDLGEILENFLNPKSTRGGSRRGRRNDRRWQRRGAGAARMAWRAAIPDVDDGLARIIPGFGRVQGRRVGPGEWVFWTGVDTLDRVFWYWLLWEATNTFTTEWLSELQESQQCSTPTKGTASVNFAIAHVNFGSLLWHSKDDVTHEQTGALVVDNNGNIRTVDGFITTGRVIMDNTMVHTEKDGDHQSDYILRTTITGVNEQGETIELARREEAVSVPAGEFRTATLDLTVPLTGIRLLTFSQRFFHTGGTSIHELFAGSGRIRVSAGEIE
jgi:hypothetical protein